MHCCVGAPTQASAPNMRLVGAVLRVRLERYYARGHERRSDVKEALMGAKASMSAGEYCQRADHPMCRCSSRPSVERCQSRCWSTRVPKTEERSKRPRTPTRSTASESFSSVPSSTGSMPTSKYRSVRYAVSEVPLREEERTERLIEFAQRAADHGEVSPRRHARRDEFASCAADCRSSLRRRSASR